MLQGAESRRLGAALVTFARPLDATEETADGPVEISEPRAVLGLGLALDSCEDGRQQRRPARQLARPSRDSQFDVLDLPGLVSTWRNHVRA